jgi:alkaline phosphatase D
MRTPRSFDAWLEAKLSRRALLVGGLALSGLPIVRGRAAARMLQSAGTTPFTLGVASGDPTDTGVVLWTRLAPDPLHGGGMAPEPVDVIWEIARDDRMSSPVRAGRATATPEWAHSVHVEVDGLEPDRWYWYRFRVGDAESAIGRTRTLPRAGAPVDRLRFGFCSCQHYEDGYFTAYRHMSEEPLDLVFHLGDYIYEGRGRPGRVREHLGAEILTIDDYRIRHAQYRLDADLQAAHAACPWVLTWDDHEVVNNYANDVARATDTRALFLLRRAAAYQAYYEHMPLRRASRPVGPSLQLYRQFAYGSLASFFVLDTRQYRTDQPCNDGNKVPCDGVRDPEATLLGREQSRWLFDGLDRSRERWHVVPQQVMMARVDQQAGEEARYSMDQWPGYEVERTRVLDFLRTRRPSNPVVLTGDIHSNWVNDLKVDHADAAAPIVATEFVVTSITSGGDGSDTSNRTASILAENPFVKFHNTQRGYVSCEVTPQAMRASYRVVDYVSRPGSPVRTRATFLVENGRPGAQRE